MAKPQDTKKASSKKEKTVKVKTAGLSEDRVVDSDSESEQKKTKTKTPVKAVEKEKGKEKGKAEKSKSKASAKKAVVPPPPPPPPAKVESSDGDTDSDSDSEISSDGLDGDDESTASESEEVAEAAKVKANGVKRKVDHVTAAEEEESSSSSESLAETSQPAAKKAKTQPKAASPEKREASAPLSAIPTKSFAAPKDFQPVDVAKLHSTFPSNLQGKQIWHITAPSALPISEIKSVGLDAIASGSAVLSHKGSDYTLAQDTSTSSKTFTVFLPDKEGYRRSDAPVDRTLHLQQKVNLPRLTSKQAKTETGGEIAADVWKPVEEGVRPQPKGMRMRYKPPGFGLGEPGLGSDDEEEGFKLPGKGRKPKKSRRESGDAMEGVESTSKEMSKEERKKAKKDAKVRAGNAV